MNARTARRPRPAKRDYSANEQLLINQQLTLRAFIADRAGLSADAQTVDLLIMRTWQALSVTALRGLAETEDEGLPPVLENEARGVLLGYFTEALAQTPRQNIEPAEEPAVKITPPIKRILVRAARHPQHRVVSHNGDALMDMQLSGLMDRGSLTPAGLAHAARLAA